CSAVVASAAASASGGAPLPQAASARLARAAASARIVGAVMPASSGWGNGHCAPAGRSRNGGSGVFAGLELRRQSEAVDETREQAAVAFQAQAAVGLGLLRRALAVDQADEGGGIGIEHEVCAARLAALDLQPVRRELADELAAGEAEAHGHRQRLAVGADHGA